MTLPLSVLLSRALIEYARDFDRVGADLSPAPSLPLWANVLRVLDTTGTDIRDVPRLARLSRRAVRSNIGGLERTGWAVQQGSATAGGGKVVRLTPQGAAVRAAWRGLPNLVDLRWRDRFGDDRLRILRTCLEGLVVQLDLELPHYPTGYGPGDPSLTGGRHVPAREGPPRMPAHGQDWSPVRRTDRDRAGLAELPLYALVSQALVAFTIDYEAAGKGVLPVVANTLRLVPDEGVPLASLPMTFGLSGNGKSLLERHHIATVERDSATGRKVVRLTDVGREERDGYQPALARITEQWNSATAKRWSPI